MSNDRPTDYRMFLLTIWLEQEEDLDDPDQWRFRLEEPKHGRWQGAVGMHALVAKLIGAIKEYR